MQQLLERRRAIALPGIEQLKTYRRAYFAGDLVAGLLVAALAVPQALGYATVAGVPVQVGLYTLPPALLAYFFFGRSKVLFVGPVSTVTVLTGSLVRQLSGGDLDRAVSLTSALAITAGLVLLIAGFLRIGWVAQFLNEPIVTGFVTGLVVLIVVGEIPGLLGMPTPKGALLDRLWFLLTHLSSAHVTTAWIALAALVLLFGGQRLAPRMPWSLIVLVGGIAFSQAIHLTEHGARVVGAVPSGIPLPRMPSIELSQIGTLITGGVAIAAVGIAEGLAAARTFKQDARQPISDDSELIANGAADLAAGIFGGMGVAGSLSKTAANARAGAKTQVSSVVAAIAVLLVLLFATKLIAPLPKAVLSAIVIHAVWGLLRPKAFSEYFAVRRNDGMGALVAFVGVLILGPLNGLLLAIVQSLAGLIYRSMQVSIDEMGKVPGEKAAWGSIANDPARKVVRKVCVLRPDGPLFWANAAPVFERMRAAIAQRPEARVVLLDLEASNQMDTTTAELLTALIQELRAKGVDLYLVRVFGNVRTVLDKAGVLELLGEDHLWHSISAAVKAAKAAPRLPRPDDEAAPDVESDDDSDETDESDDDATEDRIASRWSPREALGAARNVLARDGA